MKMLKILQSELFQWVFPFGIMLGAFISVAGDAYDMGQAFLGVGIVLWVGAFMVKDYK